MMYVLLRRARSDDGDGYVHEFFGTFISLLAIAKYTNCPEFVSIELTDDRLPFREAVEVLPSKAWIIADRLSKDGLTDYYVLKYE